MTFKKKWLEAVDKKNSVLCAGLDPAEFAMERGEKGLPEGAVKRDWALDYVESVASFCAALKPNIQYWKKQGKRIETIKSTPGDMETLVEIVELAHSLGMVVIEDSKLADIGSTNDAGIYHAHDKGFDAVTYSPFAGNMEEAAKQVKKRDMGIITMCLMSNPEYEREKNKLVPLINSKGYYRSFKGKKHFEVINGVTYVKQYIQLAHDAEKYGLDGIVIGAPSAKNHISEEEIEIICSYGANQPLVLLPGVGAQGGEADIIWKYFDKDNVIVNVGRSLMLPNGSNSTPEEQAKTAKQYQKMLNKLRTK